MNSIQDTFPTGSAQDKTAVWKNYMNFVTYQGGRYSIGTIPVLHFVGIVWQEGYFLLPVGH